MALKTAGAGRMRGHVVSKMNAWMLCSHMFSMVQYKCINMICHTDTVHAFSILCFSLTCVVH